MLIVIGGPTASGKSDLALKLALRFNTPLINGDAFQVYQKMDIGTAKPSIIDREKVPCFLFDYISPNQNYSIKQYQDAFRKTVDNLYAQGHQYIIVVGGSGLYIRSAIYDYDFNDSRPVEMNDLNDKTEEELHNYLKEIDPLEAQKIHPNNRKRVLRAIEIYRQVGMSKSKVISQQNHLPKYSYAGFGIIELDKKKHQEIIAHRVEAMFSSGLHEEVKRIYQEYGSDVQAFKAIGYKEFLPYFENKATLEETKALIIKNTKLYSKRQITFFSHQLTIKWFANRESAYKEISAFMAGDKHESN